MTAVGVISTRRQYLRLTAPFNLLTALHSPMLLPSLFGVRPAP